MEIELGAVIRALRKLFWVPLILIVVLGFAGYTFAGQQDKTYTATATLVVEQSSTASTNTTNSVSMARSLSDSYGLLIETESFLDRIADEAGLNSVEDFEIAVSVPTGSSHINISVTHTDPDAALNVANATVQVISEDQVERTQEQLDQISGTLDSELTSMRDERTALEQELSALEADDQADSAQYADLSGQVQRLNDRISETETRLDRMRLDYQLNQANLVPITHSLPPNTPNNLSPILVGLVGAMLGALIGAAIILIWAATHDVVASSADWAANSDIRLLGEVPNAGQLTKGANHVYIIAQPTDAPAESIRMLVANLDFADFPSDNSKVIQISSPGPANGKSTTASNLAVHYAQLGNRVILVDCDLHRPTLHTIFSVKNSAGLTNIMLDRDIKVQDVAQRVALPGLFLLTSGTALKNSAGLFSSSRFDSLLDQLKSEFDVVILDTPPVLLFSDSQRIASKSDGVALIGRLDHTKNPEMSHAIETIQNTGSVLFGVAWVGSKRTKNHYYYRQGKQSRFRGR